MSMTAQTARSVLKCALMATVALSLAASAAAPVATAAPPPKPTTPKPKPYQTVVQDDVTSAYEYRTRILAGKPGCQRYATESDTAFIDDKIDRASKVALIKRIGAEAGASGCLAP